jgi:hypothetical protein
MESALDRHGGYPGCRTRETIRHFIYVRILFKLMKHRALFFSPPTSYHRQRQKQAVQNIVPVRVSASKTDFPKQ